VWALRQGDSILTILQSLIRFSLLARQSCRANISPYDNRRLSCSPTIASIFMHPSIPGYIFVKGLQWTSHSVLKSVLVRSQRKWEGLDQDQFRTDPLFLGLDWDRWDRSVQSCAVLASPRSSPDASRCAWSHDVFASSHDTYTFTGVFV